MATSTVCARSRSSTSWRLPTSSASSTSGWRPANDRISGGTNDSAAVVTAAIRSRRATTAAASRAACRPSASSPSTSAANGSNERPASVSRMPRPERSNRSQPSSRPSAEIAEETDGWVTTSSLGGGGYRATADDGQERGQLGHCYSHISLPALQGIEIFRIRLLVPGNGERVRRASGCWGGSAHRSEQYPAGTGTRRARTRADGARRGEGTPPEASVTYRPYAHVNDRSLVERIRGDPPAATNAPSTPSRLSRREQIAPSFAGRQRPRAAGWSRDSDRAKRGR